MTPDPGAHLSKPTALGETPSTKPQAPEKFQILKHQTPKTRRRGEWRAGRSLSLELGASFELGVWNLDLVSPPPGQGIVAGHVTRKLSALVQKMFGPGEDRTRMRARFPEEIGS